MERAACTRVSTRKACGVMPSSWENSRRNCSGVRWIIRASRAMLNGRANSAAMRSRTGRYTGRKASTRAVGAWHSMKHTAGMNSNHTEIHRVIGLIGGMSWESSAEYYRLINQGVRDRLGPLRSAKLLMYSVDFGPIEQAQHEGRWDDAAALLEDAARRLQQGGADGVLLCTNTMHKLADRIAAAVRIPFLHIADPVADAARTRGYRKLGLLGTRFTMEQPFMRERLQQQGLEVLVPQEADRAEVHRIIYEELCTGRILEESRRTYQRIMAQLAGQGAQAMVLGCTEISLLVQQEHCPVPVLDTTALHAQAAVDFALEPWAARGPCPGLFSKACTPGLPGRLEPLWQPIGKTPRASRLDAR